MKKPFVIFLLLASLTMMAHDADAKAGGGRSMGSRGSNTYQSTPHYATQPMQRTVTPPPVARPAPTPAPSFAPAAPQTAPGFFSSHPLLTGIAGGFLGAGLSSMLFGHSGYAMDSMGGMSGVGGMGMAQPFGGGGLLMWLVLGGIAWWIYRRYRDSNPSNNSISTNSFSSNGGFMQPPYNPNSATALNTVPDAQYDDSKTPLALASSDDQTFRELLVNIQMHWGKGDLNRLRQYLTPEMLNYFSDELSALASRGEMNNIADVTVTATELLESWSEDNLDYATLRMNWNAIDYIARLDRNAGDSDYVVSGDAHQATPACEIWTFVRARTNGHWLLSAVQQLA